METQGELMRNLHPLRGLINNLWVLVASQPSLIETLHPETVRLALINAACVADEEITEPDSMITDAEAMKALWDICWHTGYDVRLSIEGGHNTYEVVRIGDHEFKGSLSDIAPQLIEWAFLLQARKAGEPVPEPPTRSMDK